MNETTHHLHKGRHVRIGHNSAFFWQCMPMALWSGTYYGPDQRRKVRIAPRSKADSAWHASWIPVALQSP